MYACMLVYLRQTYADKYGKEKEEHMLDLRSIS